MVGIQASFWGPGLSAVSFREGISKRFSKRGIVSFYVIENAQEILAGESGVEPSSPHKLPPRKLTWLAGKSTMNKAMYFLLKMVEISNNRHVSELRGVFIQRVVFFSREEYIGNTKWWFLQYVSFSLRELWKWFPILTCAFFFKRVGSKPPTRTQLNRHYNKSHCKDPS